MVQSFLQKLLQAEATHYTIAHDGSKEGMAEAKVSTQMWLGDLGVQMEVLTAAQAATQ